MQEQNTTWHELLWSVFFQCYYFSPPTVVFQGFFQSNSTYVLAATMTSNCQESDFTFAESAGFAVDRFPETNEEAQRAEKVIELALQKLSLDEHEKIIFDILGITPPEDEEPSMVEEKLKLLDIQLDQIKTEEKKAYTLACQRNPDYVGNAAFRLAFLRCEKFNVESAATMIVNHFDMKMFLFGEGDVLARDLRQSDLSETARGMLETGFCQIWPTRDAAGRIIVMITSATILEYPKDEWDEKEELRVLWYLWMTIVKDDESQKNGCVFLIMNLNGYKVSVEHVKAVSKLDASLPNRASGAHYCYDDPALRPYVAGFQLFITENEQYRLRTHFGTRKEIDFELQTYGIPAQECPVQEDGSCPLTAFRAWLAMLRAQEEREAALAPGDRADDKFIAIPRRFDVLFGKSTLARDHTGTRRCLHVVEMHFEDYEKLGKFQKTDVAEKIISIIHESGGRFLRQDEEGAWREVPDVEARKKIAHWFRHARTRILKPQESSISSTSETNTTSSIEDKWNSSRNSEDDKSVSNRPVKRVTPSTSPLDSSMGNII